jgi:L-seryl-tRNA(Ser) seleniumtransferase
MLLAALEATLRLYRDGRAGELPAVKAIASSAEEMRQRATRLAYALGEMGVPSSVVETEGEVGGGSLPLRKLEGAGVLLQGDAEPLLSELRAGTPAVVALVREGRVLLDVRCVPDVAELARVVSAARERVEGDGAKLKGSEA